MVNEFLGIIPARYASTRFPGKPLAMLGSKPMIQWVYERASKLFEHTVVATDDERILNTVLDFGGKALMTRKEHKSGTERCAEALKLYMDQSGHTFSHVVNIQGDEPLIQSGQLQALTDCFKITGTGIATLIRLLLPHEDPKNPNLVKAVVDKSLRALYFSRAPIPYVRDRRQEDPTYYAHIGLYAFRSEVLEQIVKLPVSKLEQSESLEQLRWLEHGIVIQTDVTDIPSIGVDTPEDLERISKEGYS
ncbi:MAG: 3-deoxy-manno-octulosonate cytidylyltransferase [Bacteroidota bacterium]